MSSSLVGSNPKDRTRAETEQSPQATVHRTWGIFVSRYVLEDFVIALQFEYYYMETIEYSTLHFFTVVSVQLARM